jgi:uncharacterized protein (UPF0261 family)
MTTIVLVGTLDTKGEEYRYACDRLRALGAEPLVVDTGILGDPAFRPDVTSAEVATAAGVSLERLRTGRDRGAAITAMARGASIVLGGLLAAGRLDGVLALGGSGNTTIASAACRQLPFGVPKLILSTMTAGDVRGFVGSSDLVLAASVVDIAGLNRLSRTVISNAAAAIAGMAAAPPAAGEGGARPMIAASMIGLTTRAVTAARQRLESLGYEVIVFHMTGAGGATMESLLDQGIFDGVIDLTTSELADELGGGICSAGTGRLRAAARRGIPQVVAPGGLDMINFGRRETVPARYAGRAMHAHNSEITLVRTSAAECEELGRWLGERLAGGAGTSARQVILMPLGGLSAIDVPGQPLHEPRADAALLEAIRTFADPDRVRLVDVEGNLDRPEVGALAADLLADLLAGSRLADAAPDGGSTAPSSHSGDAPCTP